MNATAAVTLALAYDTETTGLPLWGEPSEDPRQPHIVQLAAVLFDQDSGDVHQELNVIVRPDGWTIPEEVVAIHGITTERAMLEGIPEAEALVQLRLMHQHAALRVGHMQAFDARIIRIALMRYAGEAAADAWKTGAAECTQGLSTKTLNKARASGGMKGKTASLVEAYRYFTGQELVGAHSAMADARACMQVFLAIRRARAAAFTGGAVC